MSKSPLAAKVDALQEKRRDGGFTLIELLVVVVIIGILVAIAIPLYLQYQNGAKNKSAESDLRGAISTVETYYGDNSNKYPTAGTAAADGTSIDFGTLKAKISDKNQLNYVPSDATAPTSYILCSWNPSGKHMFWYDSSAGGSVQDLGEVASLSATCAKPAA